MEPAVAPQMNKKLLVIILAGFGLFLIIVMFSIISTIPTGKKEVAVIPQKPSTENTVARESQGDLPSTPAPTIVDNWKEYKNVTYSVKYPQDWQVEELIFTGGGKGINIKPTTNPNISENSSLTITLNDSSVNTIRKNEQAYLNMGFKRSSVKVNDFTATKLSGSLPKKTASSSASTKYIQTGYVILDQAGSNYLFDYTYTNPNVDIRLENIFLKIISSLKSTQTNLQ